MLDIIWIIPLLPLVGFLINALLVGRIGNAHAREQAAGYVATGAVLLAFVASLIAVIQLGMLPGGEEGHNEGSAGVNVIVWEWINTGGLHIPFGLLLDPLSSVMILLVTGVGSLIHIYSIGYMHGDAKVVRYFSYLNLFIFMMLVLVLGDNLLLLFLGWEGVGLCSFLLIGHWYEKGFASAAAVKAFVVNRIGDAAMLLAMMAIFFKFGSLNFFDTVVNGVELMGFVQHADIIALETVAIPGQTFQVTTIISFLLLIGVTGKSAQIPLFVWLPDAMAGPTPVSALIHAATMVTAGVYLIARTHPIFSGTTLAWVTWVGALTALIAATAAVAQWDIKRVLAYSTVSQLGYMVAAAGMGAYVAAIFHLLTHGVFKALLFLGSGSVIHGTHETQDMRHMGGLREHMPRTFGTYMIGALALAGIFPLAGFWSKDEIIAAAWKQGLFPIFGILLFASLLTAFYMGRQVALVFYGKQRDTHYHAHESPPVMVWPLILLAVGTVLAGFMNTPFGHFLHDWLHPVFPEEEVLPFNVVLAAVATLLGLGSAWLGWNYYVQKSARLKVNGQDPLYRSLGDVWDIMEDAWLFDKTYGSTVVPWYRQLSGFLARVVDAQGIDGMVNGVGRLFVEAAASVRAFQTGYVRNYALVFLVGVVIILGYLVWML